MVLLGFLLLPRSAEEVIHHDRSSSPVAQVVQPRDAHAHRGSGVRRGFDTFYDPGVFDLEWRKVPELGFLHKAAKAGRRNGRRHGQRHCRKLEASALGSPDGSTGGFVGWRVSRGVWGQNILVRYTVHDGFAEWRSFDRYRNFCLLASSPAGQTLFDSCRRRGPRNYGDPYNRAGH